MKTSLRHKLHRELRGLTQVKLKGDSDIRFAAESKDIMDYIRHTDYVDLCTLLLMS